MPKKYTLSVIKADIGGYVGHGDVHDDIRAKEQECIDRAIKDGLIIDGCRSEVGDDNAIIMTHTKGKDAKEIHGFAWKTFEEMTEVAKKLKQYGAGQDLLSDAFSGNLKGMGPGYAEMDIEERPSEPIVIFLADKTHPGAWNIYLYKMFADPFCTPGLVIDPKASDGFLFEVHDTHENKKILFDCPQDLYRMLAFIGTSGRYVVKYVYTKDTHIEAASTSTQKLSLMAGKYVGKDDPCMIVRGQAGLPAIGEILEPFAFPYISAGWMRGSHNGPLMPVGFDQDTPARFDGPPRVVALGFQLADAKLIGPRDMFCDISFDKSREIALQLADWLRAHGPFEPHRLPTEDMEYTAMPKIMEKMKDRFVDVEAEMAVKELLKKK